MTKDEIKKALELCSKDEDCTFCPYVDHYCCTKALQKDALALITEQEKEIERLKTENEQIRKRGILGNEVTVELLDDEVSESSSTDCKDIDRKDIEKYAKQFRNRIISINEKEVKQAKVDILNELKKCSCCDNFFPDGKWHKYVLVSDIDEFIKEIKNEG